MTRLKLISKLIISNGLAASLSLFSLLLTVTLTDCVMEEDRDGDEDNYSF